MKEIKNNLSFQELTARLEQKINTHLVHLDKSKKDYKKKTTELCHTGKFLATYFNEFDILKIQESPDFIVGNKFLRIGLEHQIIVNNNIKEKEGFYENIVQKIEDNIKDDKNIPNCLVNLFFDLSKPYKINEKNNIIDELTQIVKKFVLDDFLVENNYVGYAIKMRHSGKSVNANFGAYIQKEISKELIVKNISKKEILINKYIENTFDEQWLLLVIGSNGDSSLEVFNIFDLNIESRFKRIFLYEDFNNKLFHLK